MGPLEGQAGPPGAQQLALSPGLQGSARGGVQGAYFLLGSGRTLGQGSARLPVESPGAPITPLQKGSLEYYFKF